MSTDPTLGERIRAARRRRGKSQQVVAGLAGITPRYLRDIEQGRIPTMQTSLRIAEALGIRDLRELTGQPYAVAADGRAIHPCVEPISRALADRASLSDLPDQPPNLDHLERRLEHAWTTAQAPGPYRFRNAGALLPDLIRDAEVAYRRHRSEPSADHARYLLVMTHMLVRPLLKWVGHRDLALLPAERAMALAEDSNDAALLGAASWNLAQALSTMQQSEAAASVAAGAIGLLKDQVTRDDAPEALLAAQGALHLIASISASREGDVARSRRLLSIADTLAARIGSDTNHFRLAFGPTNVAMHRVTVSLESGHDILAMSGALGVIADRSPSVERRVAHRLDVAQARARELEDRGALAALVEADQLSPEQIEHSVTARLIVVELLRRDKATDMSPLYPIAQRLHLVA